MVTLTAEEVRVVGCLVEKQFTTPDSYPLTHNALQSACNQTSSRHPLVRYDDTTVMHTLASLRQKGFARVIHVPGSRGPKHRHILDERLDLDEAGVCVLAVLALRGPQTAAELRSRTERMHAFATAADVEKVLESLAGRDEPLVVRLDRAPGQKEARYTHLLEGEPVVEVAPPSAVRSASSGASPSGAGALEARLARLEAEVAELRRALGFPDDAGGAS